MKIIDAVGRVFFSKMFSTFSGFAVVIVVARELGATILGSYILFLSLFRVLSLFGDIGIHEGLTKRLSELDTTGPRNGQLLGAAIVMVTFTTVVLSAVIFLMASVINQYLGFESAVYLIVLLLIDTYFKIVLHTLKGEHRVDLSANVEILQTTASRALGIALVVTGYGLSGLIWSLCAGRLFAGLWGIKLLDTSLGLPKLQTAEYLFKYSKYSVITTMGGRVFSQADTLLIGFFLTQSHVAIYEVAWQIAQIFIIFSLALMSTVFPKISQLSSESDISGIKNLLHKVLHLPLLIIVPGIMGAAALRHELLRIVFGPEFVAGSAVLMVLLASKIVQSYHITFARTLSAMDMPQLTMRTRLLSIPTNVFLNVLLIPFWGLIGAAVASLVAIGVNLLLNYRYLDQQFQIDGSLTGIPWVVISSIIMFGVLQAFESYIAVTGYVTLLLALLLGGAVYLLTLVVSSDVRATLQTFVEMEASP